MGNGTLKITLEGPYRSGKTILANIIGGHLRDLGAKVVFEPPEDDEVPDDHRFGHVGFRGEHYDKVVIATKVTEPSQPEGA